MFDDGRVQQSADVHGDVARAVTKTNSMAKHLTTSLLGAAGRFQQPFRLNLLENRQKFLGRY